MEENYIEKLNMPVIAAPLFLISGPKLVIECCKNGIVGTFPSLNQHLKVLKNGLFKLKMS